MLDQLLGFEDFRIGGSDSQSVQSIQFALKLVGSRLTFLLNGMIDT